MTCLLMSAIHWLHWLSATFCSQGPPLLPKEALYSVLSTIAVLAELSQNFAVAQPTQLQSRLRWQSGQDEKPANG